MTCVGVATRSLSRIISSTSIILSFLVESYEKNLPDLNISNDTYFENLGQFFYCFSNKSAISYFCETNDTCEKWR